jgi:hypothetical protein
MSFSLAYKPRAFLRYRPGIRNQFLEPSYKERTNGPIANRAIGTWGRTVVMNERPEPDIDRVRRAMRDHDEREQEDERERAEDEAKQDEDDANDE